MLGVTVSITFLAYNDNKTAGESVAPDDKGIFAGLEHSAGINVLACTDGNYCGSVAGSWINRNP